MNTQAPSIASSALDGSVEAAMRCEHLEFDSVSFQGFTASPVRRYKRHTELPRSFVLAVTGNHVHVLAEKYEGDDLVGGEVVRSWDRARFKARRDTDASCAARGIPGDQQVLYIQLPPDCFADPHDQQMATASVAQGKFGTPIEFVVGRDAQTQRVLDVLGIELVQVIGAEPPPPSATERLQELETMRATDLISDAEYTAKRAQIIADM